MLKSGIGALLALMLLFASVSIAATPGDTAATHDYLRAGYEYDLALLQNAPASNSAVSTVVARLGRECHGALAGEPNEEAGPGPHSMKPRARGERQRSERQSVTIVEELWKTIEAARYQPDRGAIEAFAARVATLNWSNPRIAPFVSAEVGELRQDLTSVPDPCGDLKAWAQSGYHMLSPASRTFEAEQSTRVGGSPASAIRALLKPLESASERALIRRTEALSPRFDKAFAATSRVYSSLGRALGVPESPSEEREHQQVLGGGSTPAGERFVVRREPPHGQFGPLCRLSVSVEFKDPANRGGLPGNSTTSSVCISDPHERRLSTSCGEGVAQLSVAVPATVWTVRLRLSNGHTITSPVVRIPRRYGGPGGVYLQALPGYKPFPVSLTELDRHGKVVRVIEVKASVRCKVEHGHPQLPKFVDLLEGTTPSGEPFAIEGILQRFGDHQTNLSVNLSAGVQADLGEETVGPSGPRSTPSAYPWSLAMECPPKAWTILYGILSAPGESVLARTPEGLAPLTQVQLAASLHSEGPLVYGVFSTMPSELIVRRSDGTTLYSESLTARAAEDREFCEGYAEG